MSIDLPLIWGVLIAFAVFAYVVLDGFDLGIGILFPFLGGEDERNRAMNSIAPVWDGNETWLVLGGGGLFAAFPEAYSVLMTAFYAPVIAMLLALVFRGVAFEFRFMAKRGKRFWTAGFFAGSLMAALCQGMMLGAFVQGIAFEDGRYAGGWFDWFSPFSLLTGAAVACGYSLLGAGWLAIKTDGPLADFAFRIARLAGFVTLGAIVAVSALTPLVAPLAAERWFGPQMLWHAPAPIAVVVLGAVLLRAIARRRELTLFLSGLGLFATCYIGFALSKYPYIIPDHVTFRAAAADEAALAFLLPGALVLIPIILGYTGYAYWVFRGKTGHEGYGH
ncbi:cytochrome d ubiquinol oxidase subunit II [Rhodospirillum rubrum]|uniref:cytochrome d ubiquinol oxidase subunit II n=1 Tax=Rhodospirillum rubrum TaxID=1085 RepID=UPI001906A1DE|nr:cytochrome d ubiquinol oxidase subunit II [Rhodospirillum rubrum]MBK1664245.1 cytochrome d ubiquinol oxidase subunit II [Rhodospirillum rubrum]MBK1675337.1 cytochrome d ubiquinol oxidase subunit II [Rhodospirillum rubrum]